MPLHLCLAKQFGLLMPCANCARRYHPPLAARLVELTELRPGMAVLDVASGTGLVLLAAAAAVGPAGRAVGVDLSAEMLKQAALYVLALHVLAAVL